MMKNYNLLKKCVVLLAFYFSNITTFFAQINGPVCDTYTTARTRIPSNNGLITDAHKKFFVDDNKIYIATWKGLSISTDGGNTYTTKQRANGLGSDSVNRVFASGNMVYAATYKGLSISTDGGTTFTNKTSANGLGAQLINSVYASGSMVYAATDFGLSISTDGGETFTNKTIANGLGSNVINDVFAYDGTIYAATNGGLSISLDGGANYTNKTSSNGLGSYLVSNVFVSGSTIYATCLPATSQQPGGLSISSDGGVTFTHKTTTNGLATSFLSNVYVSGNTVYVSTNGGINISNDGCNSFTKYTTANGLGSNNVLGIYASGNTIYATTNDSGFNISTDGGTTFTNHRTTMPSNNGLGNNVVNGVYATGSTIYVATNGGLSISNDGGVTYENKNYLNGLGGNQINNVYTSGSTVYAATMLGLSISTDGGTTFVNKTTANGLGNNIVFKVYVEGNTVYAATSGGLSISTDGGTTFVNKTTANGLGNNIVKGVYVEGNTVYAATIGGLSISADGGTTFVNKTTANGLANNAISKVYVLDNKIYVATNGGLSISTDGGETFINKTTANGLGGNGAYGVYVLGTTVYVGTPKGLSISTDGGSNFTNYTTSNGLGNNLVFDVYALCNRIYAATNEGFSYCSSQTCKPIASAQTFCSGATIASLVATGTDLKWYATETGGNALTASTVLTSGTYYVSQTTYESESDRTSVVVTVNPTVAPAAPTASAQTFCGAKTVADLMATGTNLKWYATATGGTALASTTAIATGTYYVSQETSCESDRTSVAITVNTITAAPTASNQTVFEGVTVASLVATGTNLKWYTATTGETALASTTVITSGNYYVSQTLNSCESDRTSVAVTVIIPVKPPTMTGSGIASSAICSGTGSLSVNLATGATPYYLVNSDMSALPAGAVVGGENHTPTFTAGNPHYILLTPPNNDKRGFITFAETALKPVAFSANFGLYVGNGNGADGTSFNYGKVNTSIGYGENGMIDAGLAIGFNDYNNKIIIYYNKVQLQSYNVNGTLNNSNWKSVSIQINTSGQLTLAYGGNTYCTNYQLPAAYLTDDKTNWQYGFAARCGGLNNLHAINDVVIADHTPMQYSVDGTHYFTGNTFSNLEPGTYEVYARIGDAAYNAHGFNSTTLLGTSTITALSVAATLTPTNPTTCSTEGGTIAISDLTNNTVPYDLINLSLTNSQGGNSTFGGLGTSSHPLWGDGDLILTLPNSNTAGYIGFGATVAKPNAFSANYEMFVGGGSGGIGMSFNYGELNSTGTADTPDRGMVNSGLSIGFNDFSNTITIFYNKTQLRSYSANVNAGNYKSVAITVTQDGKLTIVHGGITICSNYQLPAAYATDNKNNWQYALAARCGGATNYHSVKNVVIKDNSIQYTIDGVNYTENPNFTNVSPGTYNVRARISNGVQCSAVSSLGSVTIATHPGSVAITEQPSTTNQSVAITAAATALSVTATGEATVSYQWYSNPTANNTGGSVIADATSASYTPPTSAAGTLYYYCVVSNACSQITSAVSGSVTTYIPVPNISYTTPVTYTVDTPIAPLTPTNTGGAVASANVVSTYAGIVGTSGSTNGPVASATFYSTESMIADAAGNVYVAENENIFVSGMGKIRKISTDGMVTTFASGFSQPKGITIDAVGNLYVIDFSFSAMKSLIKKITPAGEVTILAGNLSGNTSTADGMGAAASIAGSATGITVDLAGNVYVAEVITYKIRKITPAGLVSTLALTDVNGAAVDLVYPRDLVIDSKGNLFSIAQDRHLIQKITPAGVVTTFAGSSSSGNANGIGTAATFSSAFRMVIDAQDNIFVTDRNNHLIRKITSSAEVSTYAGITGTPGTTNGPVTTATFTTPMGIALDAAGNVFVGENSTSIIRKIGAGAGGYTITPALPAGLSIDAASGIISGTPTVTSAETDYTVTASNAGGSGSYTFKMRVISVPVPSADAQTLCSGSTVADLVATGTDLKWYDVATGGTALATSTTVATGTYYVSQTVSGNESLRTSVTVTVNTTTAPTAAAQTFCGSKTVADLVPTGTDLKWYTAATGGTDLATSTAIATGTYYVSQTLNSCEGDRALVSVTVNTTSAPTASAQTFCNSGTLANVVATGSNLKWYTAATGGTDLATSTAIATGTYYVSQTLNSCEGDRTAVAVTVTPQPTAPGKITGATTICKSSTVTYTIDPVANATSYQWTLPAGATGTSTSTSIAVTFSSSYAAGDLCVQAVNGPCLSAATCMTITPATAVPATPGVITGPATVLAPSTTKTYTIVPVANATSYVWTIPANATLVSGQGTTSATFDFAAGYTTGFITVKATNCKGNSATRSLSVKKVGLSAVRATQCDKTLAAINTTISANTIPGATKYRFEVNNGSVIQTYETTNYYFNLTQLTVKPNYNTAYSIRVAVLFDNVWQDYGSACTVTTPVTPLTKVKATQCGQTLALIYSTLSADVVVNANKYQFEISKNDIVVQELTSDLYNTRLTNLAVGAEYGTTYSIRVRYSFDTGTTWSDYGTYCSVTTPVAPLTKLRTTQCGQTLALINSTISADVVFYANKYQFEISKNNTVVQELFSNTYYTSLSTSTTKIQYGTSYTIRVKYSLDNGFTWSEYGPSCTLTTPAAPLTTKVKATQCGSTLASLNSPISADIVINANNYQFEISKDNSVIQELTSSLYYTRLTNLTAGAQNGTTYSIRVRYSFDNGATWSAYGMPCNVTSPSAQGLVIAARNSPEVSVYPNPFSSTFNVATSFEGEVNVKVIDNIGKLIEQFDIDAGELVTKELGQEYVPGMYHVTVTQEMNSKNFKVVKSN